MNSITNFNEFPIDIFTAVESVVEHTDIDPKTFVQISRTCKIFYEVFSFSEKLNGYWKEHGLQRFKSFEQYHKPNLNVDWKKLFCTYSNNIKNLADDCLQILENEKADKKGLYNLLKPYEEDFSQINFNCIAQYCLGQIYKSGFGTASSLINSFKYHKLSADQGFVNAQFSLAMHYRWGFGTNQNTELAMKYYKQAGDQGHIESRYKLSEMQFQQAKSVYTSYESRFLYYQLVADGEYVKKEYKMEAQFSLGNHYENKNIEKALKYFKLAADHGHTKAAARLMDLTKPLQQKIEEIEEIEQGYYEDQLINKTVHKSEQPSLHSSPKEQDESVSYNFFARLFSKQPNLPPLPKEQDESREYYMEQLNYFERLSKDQNKSDSRFIFGAILFASRNHIISMIGAEKAFEYNKTVADQENMKYTASSQYTVAHFYEKGIGIEENLEEAIKYYKLAADQGHLAATQKLQNINTKK